MSCSKNPPKLKEEEYEQWRKNVEIWTELTELPKQKHALAIHMVLEGRAQAVSSQFSVAELKADNGVKNLLAKLDEMYLSEEGRRQFSSFRCMYRLKRESSESIDEFLSKFEHQYYKLKSLNVVLPDTVLAFMLLEAVSLEEKEVQLILSSMTEIKFEEVKNSLRRVFGGKVSIHSNATIKSEPVFLEEASENSNQETFYLKSRGRGTFRGSFRPRGPRRGSYNTNRSKDNGRKTNPVNEKGEFLRCLICESIYHFARDCQHAYENKRKEYGNSTERSEQVNDTVQLSLLVAYASDQENKQKLSTLVKESSCAAILDCGASSSVCGEIWLEDYMESLSEFEKNSIVEQSSQKSFTFGNGESFQSVKCVTLPCYIGNMKAEMKVDVVRCNVPLLLSKSAMKKGKMILDFENNRLRIGEQEIELKETSSGHYKLSLKL